MFFVKINCIAAAQAAAPDDSSSSESDSEVERRRARARAKHMARQAAQQDETTLDNVIECFLLVLVLSVFIVLFLKFRLIIRMMRKKKLLMMHEPWLLC